MSIEVLIFTLDGALADTDALHLLAFNTAFARLGLDLRWTPEVYQRLLAVSSRSQLPSCYQEQVEALWSEDLLNSIEVERINAFNQLLKERGLAFRPGVSRVLRQAEQEGYRIAVITSQAPSSVSLALESLLGSNWPAKICAVVAGDGTRFSEVTSDMFQRLLRALELPTNTAVALAATTLGVRAAAAAGIWTVALPTFWSADQDFDAAHMILPHMGDESQPLLNVVGIKELNAGVLTVPAITRIRQQVSSSGNRQLSVPLRSSVRKV
ncbi:HAD hydrolase-like protein [Ralstonia sp. GX3-BWBA]|uniref:HAD hydrolase-like protein n=1 Tax=Ralstonia sp. GX3-BWBA TaxID=2219865 RepID=UPI000DD4370F|nr:HAD hydrolase-like protein [Ralstonia sp. GX3-BWBA]